jgi:hypothetical protein
VKRSAQGQSGSRVYNYSTLADVWAACRPLLHANGLAVTQTMQRDGAVVTTLLHTSGEWISGELLLTPEVDNAQGRGSAITYARRYSLAAILGIVSDDDDDGAGAIAPRGNVGVAANVTQNQTRPAPARHEPGGQKRVVAEGGVPSRSPRSAPAPSTPTPKDVTLTNEVIQTVSAAKTGTSSKGEWTLWEIVGVGGARYKTFKDDLAGVAQKCADDQAQVEIGWKPGSRQGDKMVEFINRVERVPENEGRESVIVESIMTGTENDADGGHEAYFIETNKGRFVVAHGQDAVIDELELSFQQRAQVDVGWKENEAGNRQVVWVHDIPF